MLSRICIKKHNLNWIFSVCSVVDPPSSGRFVKVGVADSLL